MLFNANSIASASACALSRGMSSCCILCALLSHAPRQTSDMAQIVLYLCGAPYMIVPWDEVQHVMCFPSYLQSS